MKFIQKTPMPRNVQESKGQKVEKRRRNSGGSLRSTPATQPRLRVPLASFTTFAVQPLRLPPSEFRLRPPAPQRRGHFSDICRLKNTHFPEVSDKTLSPRI